MFATRVEPASSRRGMRIKKMAKIMPTNSTMVSVRQTGRFSFSRHGLRHLARARHHSRSSPAIIRFSTKAIQMPISRGDSSRSRPPRTLPSQRRLFSPQYSSAAKAISSMMRLQFFLSSSKAKSPPVGHILSRLYSKLVIL